jgi:hypothetical protein
MVPFAITIIFTKDTDHLRLYVRRSTSTLPVRTLGIWKSKAGQRFESPFCNSFLEAVLCKRASAATLGYACAASVLALLDSLSNSVQYFLVFSGNQNECSATSFRD